ncbi:MAG TPA: hypothetical protein VFK19_02845 [Sphingomicrobium sp.]|nr:hypothetical protein [Sphingomicrobium sp.]
MRRWLPLVLLCAAVPVSSRGGIIYAGGAWAAIDRGATCEALARSSRIAAKGKVQARSGFTFSADRRRWGEFHARLRRVPRPNTSVMLKAGDQPFLLVVRGDWAWSSGPLQEQAIMAAIRGGGWMSIEARDTAGRRFIDYYALDGAATAIDAAAARCAGKSQPR